MRLYSQTSNLAGNNQNRGSHKFHQKTPIEFDDKCQKLLRLRSSRDTFGF